VEALAREVAKDFHQDLRVEVEVDEDVGSLETDRNHSLVEAAVASVRDVRGREPEVGGVTYGTDAAYLGPAFGIPMIICGPGAQGMAHQPDEYVEVDQLCDAVKIYVDLSRRLLG
jgi:acetylornithine deacetylase/succinyl-diaminopimelate desuccinylase-like protein